MKIQVLLLIGALGLITITPFPDKRDIVVEAKPITIKGDTLAFYKDGNTTRVSFYNKGRVYPKNTKLYIIK